MGGEERGEGRRGRREGRGGKGEEGREGSSGGSGTNIGIIIFLEMGCTISLSRRGFVGDQLGVLTAEPVITQRIKKITSCSSSVTLSINFRAQTF